MAGSKRPLVVLLLLVGLTIPASAQSWLPSISNVLRYGTGVREAGGTGGDTRYFENVTDIRARVVPSLTVGARLLFDAPPEVGDRYEGLSRRYVEWRDGGLALRAGDYSALFGPGLVLNTFENRGLAFDTWMDGIKGEYSDRIVRVSALAGSIRHRDSVTVTRYEDYSLVGGSATVRFFSGLEAGVDYVRATGTVPQFFGTRTIEADIPGGRIAVQTGRWRAALAAGFKRTHVVETGETSPGSGVYGSVSYSGDAFGVTMEYKDYRYDIRQPTERVDEARPTRMLPFQNPPTVLREHSYALLTRAIHEVDFNDEVGLQVEAFAALGHATTVTMNMSVASRHDPYVYEITTFSFTRGSRRDNVLPSLDDEYSPYWEVFAEFEHFLDGGASARGGLARRGKTLYNDFSGPAFNHVLRSTIVPLQVILPVGSGYSVEVQTENEWSFDSYAPGDRRAYTQYLTLILARSPDLSLSMRYEHTTSTADPSGRQDWLVGEVGYTLSGNHAATLSFGRERGGLVCSNGVCLYRLPFKGLRFSLRNRL